MNNGPAVFCMNLYRSILNKRKISSKIELTFITEDIIGNEENVIKVSNKLSNRCRNLGMLIKSFEYFKVTRNNNYDFLVWNFSVLSWYSIIRYNKKTKNVVFVNDPYSLNIGSVLNYKTLRLKLFRIFESYSCRKSYHVITNSVIIKNEIVKQYEIDSQKVSVLHKGIDCNTENKLKLNWEIDITSPIRIAFVKSDYISGGLELLYQSCLLITHLNFEIVVIGPESNNVKPFFDKSNVEIKLMGKLKDKSKLYNEIINCDIFCVPNMKEAFGQANCEAMLLQIPTIILPIDYQMALHDSSYCWIPEFVNKVSLSKSVLEIIEETLAKRKLKSERARNTILKKYNFENTREEFYSILNKIAHE